MSRVIIVGSGINGSVCGSLLAGAGHKVTILEKRPVLGGASNTETMFGGETQISRCAYVVSLFPKELIKYFELQDLFIPRRPSSITPLPDGKALIMGGRLSTAEAIAKFSKKDALRYAEYEKFLEGVARIIRPWFTRRIPYPSEIIKSPRNWWLLFRTSRRVTQFTKEELEMAIKLFFGSAVDFLDRWFENDELKATLATDGTIGSTDSPWDSGTAYVLLHHVFGNIFGETGVWGYVRGGMGKLIERIINNGRKYGDLKVKTDANVTQIVIDGGKAVGVLLQDNTFLEADIVISSAHPSITFLRLMSEDCLPEYLREKVRHWKTKGATTKVNLRLGGLPKFKGVNDLRLLQGTIHISPSLEYLKRAHNDYRCGEGNFSQAPMIEITIPSVVDSTLAPHGKYVVNMLVQWTPFRGNLRGSSPNGTKLFSSIKRAIEPYAPNFPGLIEEYEVLTPYDLEKEFGLIGGNLFHGEMCPGQLLHNRFDYSYPELRGFYYTSSATQLGGGVHGGAGVAVARMILGRKLKL